MLTKDNQFVAKLDKLLRVTHERTECLQLLVRIHEYPIIKTCLPEAATTVLSKKIEIVVGSWNLELPQLAIVRERESTIT